MAVQSVSSGAAPAAHCADLKWPNAQYRFSLSGRNKSRHVRAPVVCRQNQMSNQSMSMLSVQSKARLRHDYTWRRPVKAALSSFDVSTAIENNALTGRWYAHRTTNRGPCCRRQRRQRARRPSASEVGNWRRPPPPPSPPACTLDAILFIVTQISIRQVLGRPSVVSVTN